MSPIEPPEPTIGAGLGQIVLGHLLEVAQLRCSISEDQVMAEQDETLRDILASILMLHEELMHRERERLEILRKNLELTTPVLELGRGVLLIPLIGALDAGRSAQLTESALNAVAHKAANALVLDITGVETINDTIASHLVNTVKAVKLLGARTILTGVSPTNAQILTQLDIDLDGLQTMRTLGDGLEAAFSGQAR